MRLISSIFAAAAFATTRLFSPTSMNTVPSTTSSPSMVAAPVRRSLPMRDVGDVADGASATPSRVAMRIVAQVIERRDLPRHAHEILVAEPLDVARADVGVVALERLHEVGDRQLERQHRAGRGRHDVLPLVPADHVHLGDAGHARELRAHDPVHHGVQVGGVVLRPSRSAVCAPGDDLQDEHEDLAEARRNRPQLRLEALGQGGARLLQPLA